MEDRLNKAIEDNIKIILLLSIPISSVIYFYSDNPILFAIPFLSYLGWIYYVCFFKVNTKLNYNNERIYLERVRGSSYILSLIITFIFNFVAFIYKPDIIISLFVIFSIGIGLMTIFSLVKWFYFRFDDNKLMNEKHRNTLNKILGEVSVASIYFSIIMLIIIFTHYYIKVIMFQLIIALITQIFLLFQFIKIEGKSSAFSDQLAKDLSRINWYIRYQNILKKS